MGIFQLLVVSIHAPTWGATFTTCSDNLILKVSIHAPTWGATKLEILLQTLCFMFQSTHPHGVRLNCAIRYGCHQKFQSTHPHGVRLYLLFSSLIISLFQSTHPHGVRQPILCSKTERLSFQSTHPHGVRLTLRFFHLLHVFVSIHAPTWGATCREGHHYQ